MFLQLIKATLIVLIVTLPIWIYYRKRKNNNRQAPDVTSKLREVILFFFFLYLVVLVSLTIVPVPMTSQEVAGVKGVNYVPFTNSAKVYENALEPGKRTLMKQLFQNLVGNIVLFIPMGLLLPFASLKRFSFMKIILVSLVISICIEGIQLIERQFGSYRSVYIDDVILNVCGAILGYWILNIVYHGKREEL
jgi:glycopeptide antibiotics resistance protein